MFKRTVNKASSLVPGLIKFCQLISTHVKNELSLLQQQQVQRQIDCDMKAMAAQGNPYAVAYIERAVSERRNLANAQGCNSIQGDPEVLRSGLG